MKWFAGIETLLGKELSPLTGYAIAVSAVALSFTIKVLLDPLVQGESPFLLFFAAVMVSAFFGGLLPGLVATLLTAVLCTYYFLPPVGSLWLPEHSLNHNLRIGMFVAEGLAVSLLSAVLGSTKRQVESQQYRYQNLVNSLDAVVWEADVESLQCTFVSSQAEGILGYQIRQWLEEPGFWETAIYPEDLEEVLSRRRKAMVKGEAYELEYRMLDAQRNLVWISETAKITDEEAEIPRLLRGLLIDITEHKRTEAALRHSLNSLLVLYGASNILGSTLEPEKIGDRLLEITSRIAALEAAVISHSGDQLLPWRSVGAEDIWQTAYRSPEAETARQSVQQTGQPKTFYLSGRDKTTVGLCFGLWQGSQVFGTLEAYGPAALADTETEQLLYSLANQASGALENAWLYKTLTEHEEQLEELVGKLFTAQEEERRHVAYEIHDGLTQIAIATHQHLQAFAEDHRPGTLVEEGELNRILVLARKTVADARRVIAGLRPTALDDFGLAAAIRQEVAVLRTEGFEVGYEENLTEKRLPDQVETALYRVFQEAVNNVRKHSGAKWVEVSLMIKIEKVRLEVRDDGRGFEPRSVPDAIGPGERVGLTSMRERISLLGGHVEIQSRPDKGTIVSAEVPLSRPTSATRNRED